jgi:hypothetical protein
MGASCWPFALRRSSACRRNARLCALATFGEQENGSQFFSLEEVNPYSPKLVIQVHRREMALMVYFVRTVQVALKSMSLILGVGVVLRGGVGMGAGVELKRSSNSSSHDLLTPHPQNKVVIGIIHIASSSTSRSNHMAPQHLTYQDM